MRGCFGPFRYFPIPIFCFTLLVSPVFAQEPATRVYPGYVVELGPEIAQARTRDSASSAKADPFEVQPGPQGFALVHRKVKAAAARLEAPGEETRPYDPADTTCKELLERGFKACSPNFELRASAVSNDPRLDSLWAMAAGVGIDAQGAWDISTGSDTVVVAIIDTGIDYTHPDLAPNVWQNPGEIPGNGIDDDANGYVDDIHGINAASSDGNPLDDNGHGTHVSGTIGAVGNNGTGVTGVNWHVKLMGLKFLNSSGSGSLFSAIQAIDYMIAMKRRGVNVRISNDSWGGGSYSQPLFDAIQRARDAGILFIAAAGNASNDNDAAPSYPASYELDNVVPVAAIGKDQTLAYFSNYGATTVRIAAPGVSILSTYPNGSYREMQGTSMAAPHVAGALALLAAAAPQMSNAELVARMLESGRDTPALQGYVSTARVLDVGRMLRGQTAPVPGPAPEDDTCTMSAEEIAYLPDLAADSGAVVLQSDDDYYPLDLPFLFPFYGSGTNRIFISANGVIYTKQAPASLDYENKMQAPLNAIAALHSDMIAQQEPFGIRVSISADHVTVFWRTKHYNRRDTPPEERIEVRTTLFSDGRVENFISFGGNVDLQAWVQARSTVGVSGSRAANATTFAYNSAVLRDGLGVRFTRQCQDAPAQLASVSSLRLHGIRGTRQVNYVMSYRFFDLTVRGSGSGPVEIKLGFDQGYCPAPVPVNMTEGVAVLRGRLMAPPTFSKRFHAAAAANTGIHKGIKIVDQSIARLSRSDRVRRNRIFVRRFSSICEKMSQYVKQLS